MAAADLAAAEHLVVGKNKLTMKKFLLAAVLGLSMLSFSGATIPTDKFVLEKVECKYAQCKATAKSTGNRCKHCVSESVDKYCWQHIK